MIPPILAGTLALLAIWFRGCGSDSPSNCISEWTEFEILSETHRHSRPKAHHALTLNQNRCDPGPTDFI